MFRKALLLGALALPCGGPAAAQDGTLARTYLITPGLGMDTQFEAALGAHAALRRTEMDPWNWTVYTIETGERAGSYFIRSGDHTWADFDAYDAAISFQQRAGQHWTTTVAPLVGDWSSIITGTDTSVSWLPTPMAAPAPFVNVTGFSLVPGKERQFFEAVRQAHAALGDADWPHPYAWVYPISGNDDGPLVWLVSFHESWADMATPDPNFEAIMIKAMGEDKFTEWSERVGSSTRSTETMTMRFRPDLSVVR